MTGTGHGGSSMRLERRFTQAGKSPFEGMAFRAGDSEIRNPDGTIVFQHRGIEVPAAWSQVAADVLAQKYFRRAGVPRAPEEGRRGTTCRSGCGVRCPTKRRSPRCRDQRFGGETSARQVFHRMAGAWTYWGWKGGYFDSEADARAFYDEHCFMLAAQMARRTRRNGSTPACTGPTASTGRARATGTSIIATARPIRPTSAYERPQPHACFIQGVADDLVSEGGIMDLWVREARLFKYGSGTGSNFSQLRGEGERLSGGGQSSGLMSLPQDRRSRGGRHQVGRHDAARGQDGVGRHRPSRHRGVHRLEDARGAEGRRPGRGLALANRHLNAVMQACLDGDDGEAAFDPQQQPARCGATSSPPARPSCPRTTSSGSSSSPARAIAHIEFPTFDTDWQSEAYAQVAGPERQQLGPRHRRLPARRRSRPRMGADRAHDRQGRQDGERPRAVGQHRRSRLALGRSRRAVRHDHQRLAHLPGVRAHQRLEPVLGVHVPRRHGVQSRVAEPHAVPPGRRHDRCRGLRACHPPVDNRARDLGDDGAVPVAHDRRALLSLPHAWPGLRQPRRAADGARPRLRQRRGPGHRRRARPRS